MNAYELADQVEMWGKDLLSLNMKGGIPVIEGAKLIRQQADLIAELEKTYDMDTKILIKRLQKAYDKDEIKKRIKHSLCGGPVSVQTRVYLDGEEISSLRMTHEEANTGSNNDR